MSVEETQRRGAETGDRVAKNLVGLDKALANTVGGHEHERQTS